jgi:hypothetical protein
MLPFGVQQRPDRLSIGCPNLLSLIVLRQQSLHLFPNGTNESRAPSPAFPIWNFIWNGKRKAHRNQIASLNFGQNHQNSIQYFFALPC